MAKYMKLALGLSLFVLCVEVCAWQSRPQRVWHVKGKEVRAFSYSAVGDKVYLQTEADWPDPMIVSIKHLSAEDREYIRTRENPASKQGVRAPVCQPLDVNISVEMGRKTSSGQEVAIQAVVKYPENRTYDERLVMGILLIGKVYGSSNYVIVEKEALAFRLPVEKPFRIKGRFNVREVKGMRTVPYKYAGYLVVVKDATGKQVAVESYPNSFKKHAVKLMALPGGSGFDQKFNPVP